MPFCTYCGSSFARDEHLERHILTHTGVRPYKCEYCHMSFARKDLLHRHQQMVHERNRGSNAAPLPVNSKPAGRTPIACSNCAKNKTKCDKKFPCSRCASRNLKCEIRPTQRPSKKVPRSENEAARATDHDLISEDVYEDQTSPSYSASSSTSTPAGFDMPCKSSCVDQKPSDHNLTPTFRSLCQAQRVQVESNATTLKSPINEQQVQGSTPGFKSFLEVDNLISGEPCGGMEFPFNFDWASFQKPFPTSFDHFNESEMLLDSGISHSPAPHDISISNFHPILMPSFNTLPYPMSAVSSRYGHDTSTFSSVAHSDDFSDDSSSNKARTGSRCSATDSLATNVDAIVTAHDAWTAFKCTTGIPSCQCPRTARLNLEGLEETLKGQEMWTNWGPSWDDADYALGDNLEAVAFREAPRDKLMAITQTFLHKALEIHADEQGVPSGSRSPGSRSSFIVLPPSRVLDYCLRSYGNSFERFYSLSARRRLNPNAIMYGNNDKASSLLLLLMIAQGALISPAIDGRWLVGGLTEACRISLFDLIEKDITISGNPIVLHSALLFTNLAGWSGDKWQMDIAMGQRGMYFSMLRHTGYLEDGSQRQPRSGGHDLDEIWQRWIWHESRSRFVLSAFIIVALTDLLQRLAYAWMTVDQELSIFYDTPSLLLVTEFEAALPDSDSLWQARTAKEWSSSFEQLYGFGGTSPSSESIYSRPKSLREIYKLFLENSITSNDFQPTAMSLRLLLHPLQALVSQYRELSSCLPDFGSSSSTNQVRFEEVQHLLHRWFILSEQYMDRNPMCPTMHAGLVMYHLIGLNTVSNLLEIERLARGQDVNGSFESILWAHRSCIADVESALFHSGQVMRLVRSMPRSIRPPWWAGALYRAGLVLWCNSLVHSGLLSPSCVYPPVGSVPIPLDQLKPEHPLMREFLAKREGSPMLTKMDNSLLALDNPSAILLLCVELISDGVNTRFTEGLCSKMSQLAHC